MQRFTPFLLITLACALSYFTIQGSHGWLQLKRINQEASAFSAKNRAMESEIHQIQSEIISINNSDYTLERHAREELGLAKPGETVYLFSGNQPGSSKKAAKQR